MTAADPPAPSDDFWESSSLSSGTAAAFGRRLQAYEPAPAHGPHPFVGPAAEVRLDPVDDRFQRSLAQRSSDRSFAPVPIPAALVARVLAAVGPAGDGRRTVPQAGGIDAVHAFAVLHRVDGPLGGQVVRYDHRRHTVQPIGPAPDADGLRRLFLIDDDVAVVPAVVVALVLDLRSLVAKYGERGVRFGLQQVGHAAQNLSLRVAHEQAAGYVLGGGLDREVLALLGLAHVAGARYGGAYGFGAPAARRRR